MNPLPTLALFSLLLSTATAQVPVEGPRGPDFSVDKRTLCEGTRFETTYKVIEHKVEGPTVMVIGGVHGNEPAGAFAARQIGGWAIRKGKLIVVARANEPALRANVRRTPDLPKEQSDLNRQFPKQAGEEPTGVLATALWQLTKDSKPDYLLDLHEGFDFTQINPKSVGSSIILGSRKMGNDEVQRMLDAVNETIEDPRKKFVLKGPAVAGSIARAAADQLGITSMILETTKKDQSRAYRVRQHRLAVQRALADLGMVEHSPHVMIGHDKRRLDLTVGLYVAGGVSGRGPQHLERLLGEDDGFVVRRIGAADVRDGSLAQFDVAIFPGGSMRGQARALQPTGRDAVRDYVRSGGGYVGICAGAYLASNNYDVSLRILDADVIDRKHWARGRGSVPIEFTAQALAQFEVPRSEHPVLYVNGPIYARSEDPELPDFEVLAHYRGEVHKDGVPGGVMPGTPAIVVGSFGDGRVVCSSAHPEQTDGLGPLVRQLIRAAVAN